MSDMPPRFSVIIPVYNRAETVLPTLESVRAQTFRDFECIVVDDGSKDGEELRELVDAIADPRFRYVRRENGGASAARNTGIDQAKGEFVAFLDSDDRWLPAKLERDNAAGLSAPNSAIFSPMLVERGGRLTARRPSRGPRREEPMGDYLTRGQGFVPSSTVVVHRRLAKKVGYDEQLCLGDDMDFAMRLAAAGAEFRFIPEASSIMSDDETGDRLSRDTDWRSSLEWLERIKPLLGRKAWLAFRGWHVARQAAQAGQYGPALRFYAAAAVRGAFTAPVAAKAAVQLILPRAAYNWLRR
jgi:glycosyltransferase involved in cell wall biosynthesis